jgi:hypothetical protein
LQIQLAIIGEAAIQRAAQTMALIDPAKGAAAPPPQGTNRHLYTAARWIAASDNSLACAKAVISPDTARRPKPEWVS